MPSLSESALVFVKANICNQFLLGKYLTSYTLFCSDQNPTFQHCSNISLSGACASKTVSIWEVFYVLSSFDRKEKRVDESKGFGWELKMAEGAKLAESG